MKQLLQIFKTMEKSEFRVLIKHCFLMGNILFKQSNGFIGIIRTLLLEKQRLRGGMQTLNVQTQMMLNAQVAQIQKFSRKTQKNSTNSFCPIVNWSCVRYQRTWRYQKAAFSAFCINICHWQRFVSRVKWSNPEKCVSPSLTPRCSSYWKGSLLVALDYSHPHYLLFVQKSIS